MRKAEFAKGRKWAMRKSRRLGELAVPVQLLEWRDVTPIQVKVRHVGPADTGLEEWVKPTQLPCVWRDWPKVAKDEECQLRLDGWIREHGTLDRVEAGAVDMVFDAVGENVYIRAGGYADIDPKILDRVADRAGVTDRAWSRQPCFTARHGACHVPDLLLLALAQKLAGAEAEAVTRCANAIESEWSAEAYGPGHRYVHDLLRTESPKLALARMWADAGDRAAQAIEIRRLRGVLHDAAHRFRAAGLDDDAHRLERAIEGK